MYYVLLHSIFEMFHSLFLEYSCFINIVLGNVCVVHVRCSIVYFWLFKYSVNVMFHAHDVCYPSLKYWMIRCREMEVSRFSGVRLGRPGSSSHASMHGTKRHVEHPFASLKKQAETLFRLICCERKTLFRLKKQAEKNELREKRTGPMLCSTVRSASTSTGCRY